MADLSLQLQADNLPPESLEQLLVEGHWAPILSRLTTGENLLVEGCRGAGKTMLMRAAAARLATSVKQGGRVLGVHATFKRYLASIPPPGTGDSFALGNFKAWVNARIFRALKEQVHAVAGAAAEGLPSVLKGVDWDRVISTLETTYRGPDLASQVAAIKAAGLSEVDFRGLQGYTFTANALQAVRTALGLELIIFLLDDAAHALDTRAQGEFFTIVKSLYAEGLAFKISVYPAVTRYGLDFSYGHDAVVVSLGEPPSPVGMSNFIDLLRRRLTVTDGAGSADALIQVLLNEHQDWIRLLVYGSNANPRGLLKLTAQVLTELRGRDPKTIKYDEVRNAINYVTDRHLENMVPGIIKDLDPRLLRAAEILLDVFREKLRESPGPLQGTQPRMYLALTNSMQIPYVCTAAIRLLVAAHVLTPAGPAWLSQRENGTSYLLHPGFVFRDNVLGGTGGALTAERWLNHFDNMSVRIHAEISKTASIWDEAKNVASEEPSSRCVNGHPMYDATKPCEQCGGSVVLRSPAEIILDKDIEVLDLTDRVKERLRDHGYTTVRRVFEATAEELDDIPYIGDKRLREIRSAVESAVDEFFAG